MCGAQEKTQWRVRKRDERLLQHKPRQEDAWLLRTNVMAMIMTADARGSLLHTLSVQ
jgi:hypothetical protein